MMLPVSAAMREMLYDLQQFTKEEDPEKKWVGFGPEYSTQTIQAAVRRGLIEMRDADRFVRLTDAGNKWLSRDSAL